ncbi:hypothetical protein [Marinobacter sp.]|uniref:hypothetical protein n=1 Tax=Marinobacter sp. TaxID=50741 RepID=UPI0025BEC994|nr:hypothetical protein [Marinobacter sp.]
MSSDQTWKEKYFQELETAEKREEQWKAERNTLERMLVRTSLASEGQTLELDRLLDRVRSDLRKGKVDVKSWRELQEQIDRQVALLDEAPARSDQNHPWPPAGTRADPEAADKAGAPDSVAVESHHSQRLWIARRRLAARTQQKLWTGISVKKSSRLACTLMPWTIFMG